MKTNNLEITLTQRLHDPLTSVLDIVLVLVESVQIEARHVHVGSARRDPVGEQTADATT
jgi:hypothetical protein